MNIIDGVIFAARSDDGWDDHVTPSGRAVQRKRRSSGNGYHYRDRIAEEPPAPVLSDASRMLADPGFRFTDPVQVSILRDALIDEHRDREVAILDGPYAETAVVHPVTNQIVEAHELPLHRMDEVVARELNRVGGEVEEGWSNIHLSRKTNMLGVSASPLGTVIISWKQENGSLFRHEYPIGPLVAAARSMQAADVSSKQELADRLSRYVDEPTPNILGSWSMLWAHLRLSRLEGDDQYPDGTVQFHSVPVNSREPDETFHRGYYYTVKNKMSGRVDLVRDAGSAEVFRTLAQAQQHFLNWRERHYENGA